MTLVTPRIVNDVSYVMRINHEIHFAWQAQYLLKLEDDSCCSGQTAWLLPNDRTNFVALQPLWAARCLRRIRQPRLFVSLAVRAPLWAAHCRDCSPCTETFVALQCARCCGLRVVFVASDRPSILFPLRRARRCGLRVVFIASDNPSISFALPCCIRLPKTFVALQCMIFFL